jgi:hypothetical protein
MKGESDTFSGQVRNGTPAAIQGGSGPLNSVAVWLYLITIIIAIRPAPCLAFMTQERIRTRLKILDLTITHYFDIGGNAWNSSMVLAHTDLRNYHETPFF